MELRPYQQGALTAILQAMRRERHILAQAATGAGKTILFSALIRHCMEQYQMRIGILAHREILVRQAREKLLQVWPEGKDKIGIACASVSSSVELERPVIIGSPQTLANRIDVLPPLDLVIVDECHRVPPRNVDSQYGTLLNLLRHDSPESRVLGVTATPYRLGHGYIYGERCRPQSINWWKRLHCGISIAELQKQGFLVPLRAREAVDIRRELKSVALSGGEYNLGQLARMMGKQCHLESAVHAYQEYGEDRQHVVAFCVTIEHAEKLRNEFRHKGYPATVIHSEMKKEDRSEALEGFESGRYRVICNVGVLTEGWDCTNIDCILLCRPTKSPALFVQMVGRGLRIHPGKTDCLLLDLSNNCGEHGDVNDPIVRIPNLRLPEEEEEKHRYRTCEQCGELFSPHLRCCPACGWIVEREPVTDKGNVVMREVVFKNGAIPAKISSWSIRDFVSRKGNRMARLSLNVSAPDCANVPVLVNHYLDFEGNGSVYGRDRARHDWWKIAGTDPPESVAEAVKRKNEITMPEHISIRREGQYYNVVRWSAP